MISTPPATDARRAQALRRALERMAPALAPQWLGLGHTDSFGRALLEIAARLGGETTSRLDRTAERDALAFLDELDIPAAAPQAATATVVLVTAESQETPVSAPRRLQFGVDSDGEEVIFETEAALSVSPARLADVFAVDPVTDRIERAPARVVALRRPDPPVSAHRVATFADAGSRTLQVNPVLGLDEGRLVRVADVVHQIGAVREDLIDLLDPLPAPVAAGTPLVPVDALESFNLRDEQAHELYVGHAELLELEGPADITIGVLPVGLAPRLVELGVDCRSWGTRQGDDEASWHPLGLVGTTDRAVTFRKSWLGSVEETEVAGKSSRWLRVTLPGPLGLRSGRLPRASRLSISVRSTQLAEPTQPGTTPGTGVTRAFHNGTPLPLTGSFHPFGPEPQRFDTFAVAAAEALSKRGAEVRIDVQLVDATIAATAAAQSGGTGRAYGVGQNGHLQVIRIGGGGEVLWSQLPPPVPSEGDVRSGLAASMGILCAPAEPGPVGDLVVAGDGAVLWSGRIEPGPAGSAAPHRVTWSPLPPVPGDVEPFRLALVRNPGASGADTAAVVVAVGEGGVSRLRLAASGASIGAWDAVPASGRAGPDLMGPTAVTAVQPGGTAPPDDGAMELVVVDRRGNVWRGRIGAASTVAWSSVDVEGTAEPLVRPAATCFPAEGGGTSLWMAWARLDGSVAGWRQDEGGPGERVELPEIVGGDRFEVLRPPPGGGGGPAATIQVLARRSAHGTLPLTVVAGWDRSRRPAEAAVLSWADGTARLSRPPGGFGAASTPSDPLILASERDDRPVLLLPAPGERLWRGAVLRSGEVVAVDLHDSVTIEDQPQATHALELGTGDDRQVVDLEIAKIVDDGATTRVYQVEVEGGLQPDVPFRALRRIGRQDQQLQGTVGGERDELTLDDDDEDLTTTGGTMVIGSRTHDVVERDEGVARLAPPVAGTDVTVTYIPVDVLAAGVVGPSDIGTLVHLSGGTEPRTVSELQFDPQADPQVQRPALPRSIEDRRNWVKLAAPWRARPATASVELVDTLAVDAWTSTTPDRGYENPELSWEYFDGHGWRRLEDDFDDGTGDLSSSGTVTFRVPTEIAETDVAGQQDHWIRARLIGGDYGRPRYVVTTTTDTDPSTGTEQSTQTITVDRSQLRPPEISSLTVSFELSEPSPPEAVLVRNNLATTDQTDASTADEARFALFAGASSIGAGTAGRALYLGFTRPIGTKRLVLLADVDDQDGEGRVRVDVLSRQGWTRANVDDRTQSLRRRGLLDIGLGVPVVRQQLFGVERFWVRLRPESEEQAHGWAPLVRGLYPNAVGATHARTIEQEILGSSRGEPSTTFELSERPVLPDSVELRVREDLSDEEQETLEQERRRRIRLSGGRPDGHPSAVARYDVAPGAWALWRRVDSFLAVDGDARVYRLDPATGLVVFGDGRGGKIPPAGRDAVRAVAYQQGGGRAGNVSAWSDATVKSGVEGVESVVLPIGSGGGVEAPDRAAAVAAGPSRLRHGGQALTAADLEALAVDHSPEIVRARCLTPSAPGDPIRVLVAPRDGTRCPVPTLTQRAAMQRSLRRAAWGALPVDAIRVEPPRYVHVGVRVDLTAPTDQLSHVEDAATAALLGLLHPADGGPDGRGWPFGRRLWDSDVLRALGVVDGIDRVDAVRIRSLDPEVRLDRFPDDGVVCSHTEHVEVHARGAGG